MWTVVKWEDGWTVVDGDGEPETGAMFTDKATAEECAATLNAALPDGVQP